MNNDERIALLQDAQDKINDAIQNIADALRGSRHEAYAKVYIIGHLDNWANGKYHLDATLPKLIEQIQDGIV